MNKNKVFLAPDCKQKHSNFLGLQKCSDQTVYPKTVKECYELIVAVMAQNGCIHCAVGVNPLYWYKSVLISHRVGYIVIG